VLTFYSHVDRIISPRGVWANKTSIAPQHFTIKVLVPSQELERSCAYVC